jgi:hypothetical protein
MKKKVLVSLISDQTIPNVELIKEFSSEIGKYLFISTKKMQDKLEWIIKSTNIDEYDVIEVDAFDAVDIESKLKERHFGDEEIILNITCGTKLMSLIVNDFFRNLNAIIYYVTGHDSTYIKLHPNKGQRKFKLENKISLNEYLTAYGFEIKESVPFKDLDCAQKIFNFYIGANKTDIKHIFEPIRIRRGRKMLIDSDNLISFLKKTEYNVEKELSKKDTKYLSGDWLEEYIYYKIKNELNLSDNEITTGLNIKKQNTPNEIDIIFIYNHSLYIIECKTSILDKRTIKKIRAGVEVEEEKDINLLPEVLYKSDALRSDFGLFANTSVLTLEEIKNKDDTPIDSCKIHFDRAKLSNIKIISKRDLVQDLVSFKILLNIK